MPSLELPEVPRYLHAPATEIDLEYADLPIIDLSKASTPEGRRALSTQVRDAMSEHGFFYVINHGYTVDQTERIFDIANVPFAQVTPEEKIAYAATMKETGSFHGYKLRQYWLIAMSPREGTRSPFVNFFQKSPSLPDTITFRLFALGLELPEETLVNLHRFDAPGDTYGAINSLERRPISLLIFRAVRFME
ncbi:hypothetical protein C0993_007282 [Termitomyces sp. T159_Od127]|nr:hypothetical protein C0993_007282 [Termitomyces sp. T159_Od127]